MKPLFKVRCSSLSTIMTDPKTKGAVLSEGAKTYLEGVAKELVYGYTYCPTAKYMEKGTLVEDQSIALYNSVFFTNYVKNTERRETDFLTGECDIFTGSKIIDIKSAWSLHTFPATAAMGASKEYEWQMRGYMRLWDVDEAEVAYCLVNTPDELVGYEDPDLHYVDHIDEVLRITRVQYTRDRELEDKMEARALAAQQYVIEAMQRIGEEHQG
ncbi:hypothetical protein [Achromobacter insolitus]|uniref:hypothetical protein n=1 Tax=Achromobacter insolitus TaxID=217204 RepID=UPI002FE185B1